MTLPKRPPLARYLPADDSPRWHTEGWEPPAPRAGIIPLVVVVAFVVVAAGIAWGMWR